MNSHPEVRQFQISKNMIMHTIENQAGSIEKALLESLMNAVDAGASEVSINLDQNGRDYTIIDNGRGFCTREEILACFEVFGFDHQTEAELSKGRKYGTFGIGRAQLWAFSSNVWHTNDFVLDVDIKERGTDYLLSEKNDHFSGCNILGQFYETQSLGDLQTIQRALIKLALYLPIKFILNDKVVSKDVSEQSWTHDTDQAYVKLTETGDLDVYNLGVFVCSYSNWVYGKGGTVVSKEQLTLNTARNDILKSKCNVWKKTSKFLKDTATKDNLSRVKLDDSARQNLMNQWVSNELSFTELKGKRLLPDIQGRHHTLTALGKFGFRFTVAHSKHSQIGENIHNNGGCFVFSPIIFNWFGVETGEELQNILMEKYKKEGLITKFQNPKGITFLDFDELAEEFKSSYETILADKYTRKQKTYMEVASVMATEIPAIVDQYLGNRGSEKIAPRKLILGKSEQARAWTDSLSYIGIDHKFITCLDEGARGITRVIHVLIHEYLHNESSLGDHVHSNQFFENFHDIIIDKYTDINTIAITAKARYIKSLMKNDLAMPREYLRESNREKLAEFA